MVADHFLWFFHFAHKAQEARRRPGHLRPGQYNGAMLTHQPTFTEIAAFFGLCVWIIPLFLFLSLSANDNALPTSNGMFHIVCPALYTDFYFLAGEASVPNTPSATDMARRQSINTPPVVTVSRQSLFTTLFDPVFNLLSALRLRRHRRQKSEGLIAPRTPNRSPLMSPMPLTPSVVPPLTPGYLTPSTPFTPGDNVVFATESVRNPVMQLRKPPPRRVTLDSGALNSRGDRTPDIDGRFSPNVRTTEFLGNSPSGLASVRKRGLSGRDASGSDGLGLNVGSRSSSSTSLNKDI